jgi:hypothetical protein
MMGDEFIHMTHDPGLVLREKCRGIKVSKNHPKSNYLPATATLRLQNDLSSIYLRFSFCWNQCIRRIFQIQFLRGAGPGRHIIGKDILIPNPGQEVSDIRTISIVSITEIIVENDQ